MYFKALNNLFRNCGLFAILFELHLRGFSRPSVTNIDEIKIRCDIDKNC